MDELTRLKLLKLERLEEHEKMKRRLPHLHLYPFYPWSKRFFESRAKTIVLVAANQISKALQYGEEIPTPDGFKRIEDIRVGDIVYGSDGKQCSVTSIPFDGEDECYEFEFDEGSKVVASKDHEWVCKTARQRFAKEYTARGKTWANHDYGKWIKLSSSEIYEKAKYATSTRPYHRVAIPLPAPVQGAHKNLFDPYLVGVFLGNGSFPATGSTSVTFASADPEIYEYAIKKHGAVPTSRKNSKKLQWRLNGYQKQFEALGLKGKRSYEKNIPREYLRASFEERYALLNGLMDTDGTVMSRGAVSYSTTSTQLKNDFEELVHSLGGTAQSKLRKAGYKKDGVYHRCHDCWQIAVRIPINPFRLKRKADKYYHVRYKYERLIYSMKPVGKRRARCLTVDSPDNTFLCTRSFIVTHNSSTQIRKDIHWATSPELWPELWPKLPRGVVPGQFWYLYPTKDVASIEFEEKWRLFLPGEDYKSHPVYGWKDEWDNGKIAACHFNTGVTIYFKTYAQDVEKLQSGSAFKVSCDEEPDEEVIPELQARTNATDGYMSYVFTATKGQEYWREVVEEKSKMKEAEIYQISAYDCQVYEDGSLTQWTDEYIKRLIDRCPTEAHVQRRIFGKFAVDEGRKYESFEKKHNVVKAYPIPNDWIKYCGLDYGGGGSSHPSAIAFVAVRPDFKKGAVYKFWRGPQGVLTAAQDVLQKYLELKGTENLAATWFDWAAKDLGTLAHRAGLPLIKAEKSHDIGEGILNSLFRHRMLDIFEDHAPLIQEFLSLLKTTAKTKARDDGIDATRYCTALIPWDFSDATTSYEEKPVVKVITEEDKRKAFAMPQRDEFEQGFDSVEKELSYWADELEGFGHE